MIAARLSPHSLRLSTRNYSPQGLFLRPLLNKFLNKAQDLLIISAYAIAEGPYISSASFAPETVGLGESQLVIGTLAIEFEYTHNPAPIPMSLMLFSSDFLGIQGFRKKQSF
jgi:hypothetical protein